MPDPSEPASENPPVNAQSSASEVLKDILTKPGETSKKYQMVILGVKLLTGGFGLSTILCIYKPEVASFLTTLTTVYLTCIGSMIAVYCGGQSASEWKASAALATTSTTNGSGADKKGT